jgi:hypothetical protein
MLVRAVPEAVQLTAEVGETADEVLARCPPDARAFAFHLNATFAASFPRDRHRLVRELESRGVVPLNAAVVDISKRGIQAQCVSFGLPTAAAYREGDPDERVIAKTNHNYGGRAERQLTPTQLAVVGSPAPSPVISAWTAYRITPRRDVPDAWWDDPTLMIERFINNQRNHFHRVCFAGNRCVILRLTNRNPIKKIATSTERLDIYCWRHELRDRAVAGIHPAVGEAIARYLDGSGMDFGALEVVADDDGDAYVIDVNSTSYGAPLNLRILARLRRGLFELITDRAAQLGLPAPRADWNAIPTWAAMVMGDAKRLVNWRNARA